MDDLRDEELYQRLKASFGPTYLTVESIIQGVALADLAGVVAANYERFTLVNWLLVLMSFSALIVTWTVYTAQSMLWHWIPDLRDAAIPFIVGALELFLNHTIVISLTAWLVTLAAIGFVGALATKHIDLRAKAEPENTELLQALRSHHSLFARCLFVDTVILLALAWICNRANFRAEYWGHNDRGMWALLVGLAAGACFLVNIFLANEYVHKAVSYARTGRSSGLHRLSSRYPRAILSNKSRQEHMRDTSDESLYVDSHVDEQRRLSFPATERNLRWAIGIAGVIALVLSLAFAFNWGGLTRFVLVPQSSMPFMFLCAVSAAIGVSALWISLSGELVAALGGILNLLVFWSVMLVSQVVLAVRGAAPHAPVLAIVSVIGVAIFGALLVLWRRRFAPGPREQLPWLIRGSFGVYIVLLAIVGVGILLGVPTIYPWPLNASTSAVLGSFYVGAACYFAYGLLRPNWQNVTGQMWAFLAYDAVLIGPFIAKFGNVLPSHVPSLVVSSAVLIISAAISAYYVLVIPAVRWARARGSVDSRERVSIEQSERRSPPPQHGSSLP